MQINDRTNFRWFARYCCCRVRIECLIVVRLVPLVYWSNAIVTNVRREDLRTIASVNIIPYALAIVPGYSCFYMVYVKCIDCFQVATIHKVTILKTIYQKLGVPRFSLFILFCCLPSTLKLRVDISNTYITHRALKVYTDCIIIRTYSTVVCTVFMYAFFVYDIHINVVCGKLFWCEQIVHFAESEFKCRGKNHNC